MVMSAPAAPMSREPIYSFTNMKKSELKALIREIVENMYARHNPEGDKQFGSVPGVWNNEKEVADLKSALMDAIDAGNFDIAKEILDKLV